VQNREEKGYYKKLREEVKNMVIPKKEFKSPEVINKVQKKLDVPVKNSTLQKPSLKPPSNPKQPKNQGYLNPSPKEVHHKLTPNPSPEQGNRPISNRVPNRSPNDYVAKKEQVVKPIPNFYVQDYKPYKYEEPAGAMVIPVDAKAQKKPQSQANQRKKLEELKVKEEQKKKELRKEQKKREEERNERKKKLDQERINMRKDIEKRRRDGNKFNNKEFKLIQVPNIIATDSFAASLDELIPPEVEPQLSNTAEEIKKEVKEVAHETAKFAEEQIKVPVVKIQEVDPSVKSKSIRMQVDQLTRSIMERQKAKLKEEEQLEKDAMELANAYRNVTSSHIIGSKQLY
jgi:hypothetical protein